LVVEVLVVLLLQEVPVAATRDYLQMVKRLLVQLDYWHKVVVLEISIRKLMETVLDAQVRVEVVVVQVCRVHSHAT
jgi:hypothetical protein